MGLTPRKVCVGLSSHPHLPLSIMGLTSEQAGIDWALFFLLGTLERSGLNGGPLSGLGSGADLPHPPSWDPVWGPKLGGGLPGKRFPMTGEQRIAT